VPFERFRIAIDGSQRWQHAMSKTIEFAQVTGAYLTPRRLKGPGEPSSGDITIRIVDDTRHVRDVLARGYGRLGRIGGRTPHGSGLLLLRHRRLDMNDFAACSPPRPCHRPPRRHPLRRPHRRKNLITEQRAAPSA
jgi:hypothetical protein